MASATWNRVKEDEGRRSWRRIFPRYECRGIVRCRPGKWGMGKEIEGRVEDISQDGAMVLLSLDAAVGDEMELEFTRLRSRSGFRLGAIVKVVDQTEEPGVRRIEVEFARRLRFEQVINFTR